MLNENGVVASWESLHPEQAQRGQAVQAQAQARVPARVQERRGARRPRLVRPEPEAFGPSSRLPVTILDRGSSKEEKACWSVDTPAPLPPFVCYSSSSCRLA